MLHRWYNAKYKHVPRIHQCCQIIAISLCSCDQWSNQFLNKTLEVTPINRSVPWNKSVYCISVVIIICRTWIAYYIMIKNIAAFFVRRRMPLYCPKAENLMYHTSCHMSPFQLLTERIDFQSEIQLTKFISKKFNEY